MPNYLIVGRRHIPRNHIAFVEPFDAEANPKLNTSRGFHARLVLINRDSVLLEEPPRAFAEKHDYRVVADDNTALNPAIWFRVESFLPQEGFTPTKAFASRIIWQDFDGNDQSKLLLSEPESILSALAGERQERTGAPQQAEKPARRRSRRQVLQRAEA